MNCMLGGIQGLAWLWFNSQSLGVKNCVGRVHCNLILCCIPYEAFSISEGDIGWRCPVALVVGDDLNTVLRESVERRMLMMEDELWGF